MYKSRKTRLTGRHARCWAIHSHSFLLHSSFFLSGSLSLSLFSSGSLPPLFSFSPSPSLFLAISFPISSLSLSLSLSQKGQTSLDCGLCVADHTKPISSLTPLRIAQQFCTTRLFFITSTGTRVKSTTLYPARPSTWKPWQRSPRQKRSTRNR